MILCKFLSFLGGYNRYPEPGSDKIYRSGKKVWIRPDPDPPRCFRYAMERPDTENWHLKFFIYARTYQKSRKRSVKSTGTRYSCSFY
jgi:hypothetical protein